LKTYFNKIIRKIKNYKVLEIYQTLIKQHNFNNHKIIIVYEKIISISRIYIKNSLKKKVLMINIIKNNIIMEIFIVEIF